MSSTPKLTKKQLYKIATIKNIKGRSFMRKSELTESIRKHYLIQKYFYKWYENAVNINNLKSFVQIDTTCKRYDESEKLIMVMWNKNNKKLNEIMMREYNCRYEDLHLKKSLFWIDIAKNKFNYRRGKKMELFTKSGYCSYFTVYHCEEPRTYNDIFIGEDGIVSMGCYNYPTKDNTDPKKTVGRWWPEESYKVITDKTHLYNEKLLNLYKKIVTNNS